MIKILVQFFFTSFVLSKVNVQQFQLYCKDVEKSSKYFKIQKNLSEIYDESKVIITTEFYQQIQISILSQHLTVKKIFVDETNESKALNYIEILYKVQKMSNVEKIDSCFLNQKEQGFDLYIVLLGYQYSLQSNPLFFLQQPDLQRALFYHNYLEVIRRLHLQGIFHNNINLSSLGYHNELKSNNAALLDLYAAFQNPNFSQNLCSTCETQPDYIKKKIGAPSNLDIFSFGQSVIQLENQINGHQMLTQEFKRIFEESHNQKTFINDWQKFNIKLFTENDQIYKENYTTIEKIYFWFMSFFTDISDKKINFKNSIIQTQENVYSRISIEKLQYKINNLRIKSHQYELSEIDQIKKKNKDTMIDSEKKNNEQYKNIQYWKLFHQIFWKNRDNFGRPLPKLDQDGTNDDCRYSHQAQKHFDINLRNNSINQLLSKNLGQQYVSAKGYQIDKELQNSTDSIDEDDWYKNKSKTMNKKRIVI